MSKSKTADARDTIAKLTLTQIVMRLREVDQDGEEYNALEDTALRRIEQLKGDLLARGQKL